MPNKYDPNDKMYGPMDYSIKECQVCGDTEQVKEVDGMDFCINCIEDEE